ncbi:MAG TPA: hypothetical protein VIY96_06270 [Thermoanaerobaculia bacterium]
MKTQGWISVTALVLVSLTMLTVPAPARGQTPEECPGADLFVMPREAVLREKPKANSRAIAVLPAATRLKLVATGERYLRVDVPNPPQAGGPATGYVAREVTAVFPEGAEGTRDLVAVGRTFARTETYRRLAAAFLLRATERLRDAGTPDPSVELLLGETAEALANVEGTTGYPAGLAITTRPDLPGGAFRHFYRGDAFEHVLEMTKGQSSADLSGIRDRATAGLLRARYPMTSLTLAGLWQETAAWLQVVESATDPAALVSASERLGDSSLVLGRYLLAAEKLDAIATLETRIGPAGGRVAALLPNKTYGRKLISRSLVLHAMRGDGTRSFPQEARVRIGPGERIVRIEGKLGALTLTSRTSVGSTSELPRKSSAIPVLPVPGSLRISPDGKSAAWIEVIGPSTLMPVIASLTKDEPAREIAFLSDGRPLRDRSLAHVVGSISGYSADGARLGLSISAWNDTPGPAPRFTVVSVATGELLFETSKDMRAFQRLLQ